MGHLGATVEPLGPSWGRLGAILSHLGAVLEPLGGFLGHLGALLGPLGDLLDSCSGILNPARPTMMKTLLCTTYNLTSRYVCLILVIPSQTLFLNRIDTILTDGPSQFSTLT